MNARDDTERRSRLLEEAMAGDGESGDATAKRLHEMLQLAEEEMAEPGGRRSPVAAERRELSEISRAVLVAARSDLEHNARRAYARRVARALAAAVVPLPLIAAMAFSTLRHMHSILAEWLPALVADYLVASYAALGVLLIAATYAAIPLLAERLPATRTLRLAHGYDA